MHVLSESVCPGRHPDERLLILPVAFKFDIF